MRPWTPRSPRRLATCSSRRSVSLCGSFRRNAPTPPSRASKRTTPPRSTPSATAAPRPAASRSEGPPPNAILALRADGQRGQSCWSGIPTTRRAPSLASTASRPARRSPSVRASATLEPFVLRDGSQFRPGPPHAVTDPRYTADFNEVKRLGGDGVTTPSARTPDQTEIALFWFESSPLQWNRIARTVAARDPPRPVGAGAPARLAQHGPGGRLHRDLRDEVPLQLLAAGHRDPGRGHGRQPATRTPTRTWTPLRETPPIPDYDSGHAVEGGAAAEVLRRFFGTDRIALQHLQHDAAGAASNVRRRRARVADLLAASPRRQRENGVSRILIGFHFREAVEVGIEHGRRDRATARSTASWG